MAKLVVLSEGLAGRAHELKVEKTTIGRVEDNTFQIAEPSVSSHHCEVILRGNEIVVKDLNSTNGTFINGNKITEAPLKAGATLRLGQIELRLDDAGPTADKKTTGPTSLQRGVNLSEFETAVKGAGFDSKTKGFSKKDNKAGRLFWIGVVVVAVVIVILLVVVFLNIQQSSGTP